MATSMSSCWCLMSGEGLERRVCIVGKSKEGDGYDVLRVGSSSAREEDAKGLPPNEASSEKRSY